MTQFSDPTIALYMRNVIKEIIRQEVDRTRPRYRYAKVISIDLPNYRAVVQYPGSTDPIVVKMFSIQPTAAGQIVRIEGMNTDRYIADVVGAPGTGTGGGGGTSNVVTGSQDDLTASSITSTLAGPGSSATVGPNALAVGQDSQADGDSAIAIGNTAQANTDDSIALGDNAIAEGDTKVIAIGNRSYAGAFAALAILGDAENQCDVAIGNGAATRAYHGSDFNFTSGHIAIGTGAIAGNYDVGQNSAVAIGNAAQATGQGSIVLGENFLLAITGEYAIAIGYSAQARGDSEVALGNGAGADYQTTGPPDYGEINAAGVAIGDHANSTGARNIAIGQNALTSTDSLPLDPLRGSPIGAVNDSIAIGTSAQANHDTAIAIGLKTIASGLHAIVIGFGDDLNDMVGSGASAIAIGFRAQVANDYAVAIGWEAESNGDNCTAVGYRAKGAEDGTAIGTAAWAQGTQSTAIGGVSGAGGAWSTALGNSALAEQDYDIGIGANSDASGGGSVAIGTDNTGAGAQAPNLHDFVLGTDLHNVAVPGRFNVARRTPSSSSDAQGTVGDITSDDNYFYAKTSTGWKRAALSTF